MTLIEAIKTGKPIRRKTWLPLEYSIIPYEINNFQVIEIIADDWEIYDDSPKQTISEKQLEDALSLLVGDAALERIKEKLGF